MQTLASQLSCKLSLLNSHQLSFSFDRGFIISSSSVSKGKTSDYEEVGGPSSAHETSGYETPGQNETYGELKKSPKNPGYTELDKNRVHGRNRTDDGTYQKLVKRDSDYVIPAHERRQRYESVKMGRNLPDYTELDLSKREVDDYQKLVKTCIVEGRAHGVHHYT